MKCKSTNDDAAARDRTNPSAKRDPGRVAVTLVSQRLGDFVFHETIPWFLDYAHTSPDSLSPYFGSISRGRLEQLS